MYRFAIREIGEATTREFAGKTFAQRAAAEQDALLQQLEDGVRALDRLSFSAEELRRIDSIVGGRAAAS